MRAILVVVLVSACVGAARPKFPDDVAAAVARDAMRRMETATFVIYYPEHRKAQAIRFAARAEGCGQALRSHARVRNRFFAQKPILVLPDVPFNNAYVMPPALGDEDVAVIPTYDTFDFTTEFGIPPDPTYIACHELTHYTHGMQMAGLWGGLDVLFGSLLSPQIGLDSWFWEGLATHYESALQPGVGRPRWPIFTGIFAAAFAGRRPNSGDLSELQRLPTPGGNYLMGTMFIDFLARRYGEEPLWKVIETQASSWTIIFAVSGRFKDAYGKSLLELFDEFADETAQRWPVRHAPAAQRRLRVLGDDARYARGADGTEAVIANDVDVPTRLTVYGPDGGERAQVALVGVVPPRTLVAADPVLVSGFGVTAAGDVYFTALDQGATFQTTRLLRLRRGDDALDEVARDLGPGAFVSPDGRTYYYLEVDGDRWSLAAYDLASGARKTIAAMPPGQYVLRAQPSPDGRRAIASVWDGRFSLRVIDLTSGATMATVQGAGDTPVYDGAFVDDDRVTYLAAIDGRFQVAVRSVATGATTLATDVPYAALDARAAGGTIRFLNREGWSWTLDEVALPPAGAATAPSVPVVALDDAAAPAAAAVTAPSAAVTPPSAAPAGPATADPQIHDDAPYHFYDHLFTPTLHSFVSLAPGTGASLVGASIAGSDRLGWNRWSATGYLQLETREPSGEVTYLNSMLAPWLFQASVGETRWTQIDHTSDPDVDIRVHEQELTASASFGRTWRGSWSAAARFVATGLHTQSTLVRTDDQLIGPGLSLAYSGFESTADSGARRGLALSLDGTWYPARLAEPAVTITDLRGQLDVALPVPGLRRPTLHATAVARDLVSSTSGLLVLGGSPLLPIYALSDKPDPADSPAPDLPGPLLFLELLRGYEDFFVATDRVVTGEASWRWPLIIDRGTAVTAVVLPSSFVRQVDLELFASGAVDETVGARHHHAAAGGAITLRAIAIRILPLIVRYQVARRLYDDDAWTQRIELGFGF